MFSVVSVRQSVILSTGRGGTHVAITHDVLNLTVQGAIPSGHWISLSKDSLPPLDLGPIQPWPQSHTASDIW